MKKTEDCFGKDKRVYEIKSLLRSNWMDVSYFENFRWELHHISYCPNIPETSWIIKLWRKNILIYFIRIIWLPILENTIWMAISINKKCNKNKERPPQSKNYIY